MPTERDAGEPNRERDALAHAIPSTRSLNRLACEKSPYLLQHQHNPVDWYGWSDEAFAKARHAQRPIFLSIGYSTCHWCHVMERESFEDARVAEFLNQYFVSIKVDREERPDVDKIYMTFVQSMGGAGGWPLNVFLTPGLKPFFGGTYWPPAPRHQRPSFLQVLEQVKSAWHTQRADILQAARDLHQKLIEIASRNHADPSLPERAVVTHAGAELKAGYDSVHGGWGSAPKFPVPSHQAFVLWHGVWAADREAVQMVLHTCARMASGGIYDQLGGGFARYSTDAQWRVPHFEKMLYDNAQLLGLYLDCHLVSGNTLYADVARDIVRYVLRDMTDPKGGFYCAEDADSEGKEGKFYCWTQAEVRQLLTPAEFAVAVRAYGITLEGNFLDYSDPDPLSGQNVLNWIEMPRTPAELVLLATLRAKLFAAREKRARPLRDDKVLASWNGLMLSTLARAAVVLREPSYLAAAERNLAFLQTHLWDATNRTLYHRWRDGSRDSTQLLEAYAFLLSGVVSLYEATLYAPHLEFAVALAEGMLQRFYDAEAGGFWQSQAGSPDLILPLKEDYDGAEPSGNSVAILALLKLSAITARADFRAAAEKSLQLFAERLRRMPQALANMLLALDFALTPPQRVVLAGDPNSPAGQALLQAAHAVYQPHKVVLGTTGPVEPFAQTLSAVTDLTHAPATVYLCTGSACLPPTQAPAVVACMLRGEATGS